MTTPTQSLFDRFAPFYDADYRRYRDDIEMIAALADEAGDPVLELGCGTGRVLAPLAAQGHAITGVDISPALLDVARRKLELHGLTDRVARVQADLCDFDLPQKNFRFAFCTSNTLMHLDSQDDQMDLLRNVHRHLQEDGLLFIDLFNPDIPRLLEVSNLQELADQWHDPETGNEILKWSVRTVDLAEQLQDTLFIYEEIAPDGATRRTTCQFTLRYLWRGEAELMLHQCGYDLEAVWGDFDASPYDSGSERLILLARKRELKIND